MAARDLNKIKALKEETYAEGDIDDDFLEQFAQETGWKSSLLYQYLSGYIVMIALTALIGTAMAWLDMMHLIINRDILPSEKNMILIKTIYLFDFVYVVDILFRIMYAITKWPNKKLFHEPVPIEFIILDILSVIPYDIFYASVRYNPLIESVLRLRVTLRLYRVGLALSQLRKMFQELSIMASFLWTISFMSLCMIIPSSLEYVFACYAYANCKYGDYGAYIKTYSTSARFMMTSGADNISEEVEIMYHLYSILSVIYFVVTMFIVAKLACRSIDHMNPMYCFIHDYQKTIALYNNMKIHYKDTWTFEDDQIYVALKDYYYHYLRQRNGISAERVLNKILPYSITKSIIMDMAFDSFRHSHIFRNLELNIIRFLSALVRFDFAVPGEVIVRKGDMFNKMIYISHGVLQILSHEDGETPVLNLSGGTSLGETTLFLSYPLNCSIICQSYCEMIVIDKFALQKMIEYYPTEYRGLVKSITGRFAEAKKLRGIVGERMDAYLIKSDLLIMSWIKQFQRCFLRESEQEKTSMDSKIRGLQYYIDNLVFYVAYLDKVVVSEEIELVKDTVFLKATYHFILQPQSPILMVWNIIVLLLTVFFIIMYPFNLCYPHTNLKIQMVYSIFLTIIFWIDIYLQMFTAVKTRGATYLTFQSILVYRIRQKEFLVDCFAALPLEHLVVLLSGTTSNVTLMFLQANRLLKYYKIISFFDDLNVWSTSLLTAFNYIKYITHFLFFYYYATMITFILNCYDGVCTIPFMALFRNIEVRNNIGQLLATLPLSNALISGVILGKMPLTEEPYVFIGYTMVVLCSYLLKTLFLVNVISSSAVQNYALLKEQERFLGIAEALEWFEVSKSYKTGISAYLNTLFYFNSDMYTHFNDMVLPTELGVTFRNIHLARILGENPFFGGIPTNLLSFLSSNVKMVIIPAGLVVFYCGQAIDECFVIQYGFCTMWYGNIKRDVSINENLGLVEVLLDIPIFHTIITRSDCVLMKFSKQDLHRFFSQYRNQSMMVYNALGEFAKCEHLLSRNVNLDKNPLDFYNDIVTKMEKFKRLKKPDRKQINKMLFTQHRIRVIHSWSRGLFVWEIVKNIAWVLSLSMTAYVANVDSKIRKGILIGLDSFSISDLGVRFFVTYFNKDGLEITTVPKTMLHYLTHAFFIDLVSVFPFDLFVDDNDFIFARFNRYIQCYRVLGLAYYSTTRIKKVHQYVYIAHLTIFTMFTLNLAVYYVNKFCKPVKAMDGTEVFWCESGSWQEMTLKRFDIHVVYEETFLFLLSIFFGIGFRRYELKDFWERVILAGWGIFGHLTVVIIIGRAVSYFMFRNADLTTYQEAMKDLVRFLSYCDIDRNIKHEVIQHFEYIWQKRQGKNIAVVIESFPTSVKKDLLFNIYGKHLRKNVSIFKYADDNFLKSLLMIVKQETYRKTGIIYKVDDIHGTIYFLLRGKVEVVGPDENRLITLVAGSIFGCLDDCTECRQTLTMVANGHVETLAFSSVDFYKLLSQHPKFRAKFLNLANMRFDFVPSYAISQQIQVNPKRLSRPRGSIMLDKLKMMEKFRMRILKPSKHLRRLEITLFVFEFFIGSMYELILQVVVSDLPFWLIAYFRDALWILRMYLKFHVAYENEFGMLEYNRINIARRYLRQKAGFGFDLFCIMPIDCLMFAIPNDRIRNRLFLLFRLNRFFRCYHLFRHMSRTTKKLNINVLLMRTAYILLYAFLYIELKFMFYYWSETLFEFDPMYTTNIERVMHSLIYVDTILLIFTQAPVPYTDYYRNYAPSVLGLIICLDACFLVFFFSNFAGTLQIATKVKSKYLNVCYSLKLLMVICDASNPLIEKIQMYTNLLLRIRNGIQFPFLLEHAPYYLREAVLNSMFGFHLRNHYLFKDCHVDFLRQLAATMRTLTYFEGNHICDKGDIDETMYFIQEGIIQALTKDTLYTEVCEHLLIAGESFGLDQILNPRCGQYYAYRASMLTTLVTINRTEFTRLITFFPSVKKHIYNRAFEFAS